MVSGSKNSCSECRLSVARETAERMSQWTGPRPERPFGIRPFYDRSGLDIGHWSGKLAERQLFDLPAGRKKTERPNPSSKRTAVSPQERTLPTGTGTPEAARELRSFERTIGTTDPDSQ